MSSREIVSIVIPTHNRRAQLARTLRKLEQLDDDRREVIVIDNASTDGTIEMLRAEFPQVRVIRRSRNVATLARQAGLENARGEIVLMLDDDSWPLQTDMLGRLRRAFADNPRLAVAAARIVHDPAGRVHEAGGLPGVFLGCGAGVRKEAALAVGGYPADFHFYAEEYELSCRLIRAGWQVRWFEDLLVLHEKVATGRDKRRIFYYLARNNIKLWYRHAPKAALPQLMYETLRRYRRIAAKEKVGIGFWRGTADGLAELLRGRQRREPISPKQLRLLLGLQQLRRQLDKLREQGLRSLALACPDKHFEYIVREIREARLHLAGIIAADGKSRSAPAAAGYDAIIIGTLSPGGAVNALRILSQRFPNVPVYMPLEFNRTAEAQPAPPADGEDGLTRASLGLGQTA